MTVRTTGHLKWCFGCSGHSAHLQLYHQLEATMTSPIPHPLQSAKMLLQLFLMVNPLVTTVRTGICTPAHHPSMNGNFSKHVRCPHSFMPNNTPPSICARGVAREAMYASTRSALWRMRERERESNRERERDRERKSARAQEDGRVPDLCTYHTPVTRNSATIADVAIGALVPADG